MKYLTVLILLVFSIGSLAEVNDAPKTFVQWKEMEVNDARNRVVRLSNNLLLLKSEKYNPRKILPEIAVASKEEDGTDEQESLMLEQTEKQLALSLERLEFSKELTINEYFSVYLSQFRGKPEALKQVAESLSKDEVAELLQVHLGLKPQEPTQSSQLETASALETLESRKPSRL